MKRVRERLATEAGAPDPRQHQYATVVVLAVVAASTVGWAFGLAAPTLLAGLTTAFALVGAGGQSLRADLHRFSWFVPALVLVMTGGPLLMHVPLLAGLLVSAVVFGAGMLPAMGERSRIAGQTFAAATLMSTTTGIGSNQPALVLFGAAVTGALFALLLRVVIGLGDPTRSTRAVVASTLTEPGPGVIEHAALAWRGDNAAGTWLEQVLAGAARFRAARETMLAQAQRVDHAGAERLRRIVAEADVVAAELAKAVRASACIGLPSLARVDPAESVLRRDGSQDMPDAARGINEGLDRIRAAVIERDVTMAPRVRGGRLRSARAAVRAHLSLRSSLFRHALRCTLAVGAGMVIVLLLQDPSVSTLLLSLYVVLQPAARDSMTGALERTGGVVLGVAALAILITLLPGAFLLVPVAITTMLLRAELLRSDYRILLGSLIAVTVVTQAMMLQRSLIDAAIGFAANTAIGAAIALIIGYIGYLVLPGSLVPDVAGTVRATVRSISELLHGVRDTDRGADLWQRLRPANILALRRTQDLLGMPALLDGTGDTPDDARPTRAAAVALEALRQDLAILASQPAEEQAIAMPALRAVDDLLGGRTVTEVPDIPDGGAPATELLASSLLENALHARVAIDETLGYDDPWKSYTLSFVRTEHLRIQ
ncbi:FUSC family protein [Haloactinomyces albus]|uniref:Membrane protein YccC n=1 Tax=Haloactinomyces albus TaxID=1352928 RepID=A0AAE3ZCZ3_9ACTN|nr:FUSC family protein [Haloactinomyces albus]MDR7301565.1 putative membrane protein YccC [Haloactinomyces albus]